MFYRTLENSFPTTYNMTRS